MGKGDIVSFINMGLGEGVRRGDVVSFINMDIMRASKREVALFINMDILEAGKNGWFIQKHGYIRVGMGGVLSIKNKDILEMGKERWCQS